MKNTIKLLSVALLVTNVTQVFSAAGDDAKPRKRVPFNAAAFLAAAVNPGDGDHPAIGAAPAVPRKRFNAEAFLAAAVNPLEQQPIGQVQVVPPVPVNAGKAPNQQRQIDLGNHNMATLNPATLDEQLEKMPVGGAAGRFTIGERSIKPTMKVVEKILNGNCILSDEEVMNFLLCVAGAMKMEVSEEIAGDGYQNLIENPNIYVKSGHTFISSGWRDASIAIGKAELLEAYGVYKGFLTSGKVEAKKGPSAELLANIAKVAATGPGF